ncbi:ATP-binding protein [bacterium]|nr:MAG: ATP-binding protein [bacterium]
MAALFATLFVLIVVGAAALFFVFSQYKKTLREAKNYERGLKMVPMFIHLPPASEDLEKGGRDERDFTEEVLSEAQVMYNIIASTATKGFKNRIYGQRHISFEIVAKGGLVHYYAVVPMVLIDVIKQAIAAAYPAARLEEVSEHNIFNQAGKMSGVIGGEFTLKKKFIYPIATYQESKRDAARALLNALSAASREDGVAIQFLMRPAQEGWVRTSVDAVKKIRDDKGKSGGLGVTGAKGAVELLWKPPEAKQDKKPEEKQLTALEEEMIKAIEEKTRYPGYEVLVRVVVSSNTTEHSQSLLKNIVAAFSLFDSPSNNGFKFTLSRDIEELVTSFIFRFFPQTINYNVLNSVELATIFHLPDQSSIPTSKVQRQMSKQVDGPNDIMETGLLLGVNEFRGIKKEIRLSDNDRRRHTYVIGQTGVGKSIFLENLAYQDMHSGKGFAFIDPHGDSAEALLSNIPKERVEDVIYFNPGDLENPIGLNLFEWETEDQKDFLVQESINMLYSLYDPGHTGIVGPRMEHIFRNCALLLMSDPAGGTFIDIPKLLVDNEFMKSKLKYVTDRNVLDFWTKEYPASQRSNESGEVTSWVVSKFGPFLSNTMMRNIMGQTKSGFNIRDIMDNRKILLVNLSKGKMGELNSKLIGMIFVMKFQAAAMARADMPEQDRIDFCLYVDEFQNFATESFESILSEARKYRLNLVLGNQFMTQLTDKIREAIIGNVGTVISGRIGVTDAELMVKKFSPIFDAEDLTKLPNYQAITSVMINNVPSAPFSMLLLPPMGQKNPQLADAMKRLSSTKYGFTRAVVEKEIFGRLEPPRPQPSPARPAVTAQQPGGVSKPAGNSGGSFLDDWLAKRQKMGTTPKSVSTQQSRPLPMSSPSTAANDGSMGQMQQPPVAPVASPYIPPSPSQPTLVPPQTTAPAVQVEYSKDASLRQPSDVSGELDRSDSVGRRSPLLSVDSNISSQTAQASLPQQSDSVTLGSADVIPQQQTDGSMSSSRDNMATTDAHEVSVSLR